MEKSKGIMESCNLRKSIEILLLCSAILLLWSFQTLPVIFYNLQAEYASNSSMVKVTMDCSNPHLYENGLCFQPLTRIFHSYGCEESEATAIILAARNSEPMAAFLLNSLNILKPSNACRNSILPFYCLYLFGLCDGAEEIVLPTQSQCNEVQISCSRELNSAAQLGFSFPGCDSLPQSLNISCPTGRSYSSGNDSTVNCQKHFMYDQNFQGCVTNCYTWNWNGDVTAKALQIVLLLTYSIGLVLSLIILVISGVRHKSMLEIPSVFLIYTTLDIIVLDFFGILSASNRSLFCSSSNILNSTVTSFCSTYGIVFIYFIIQVQLWWLFHLSLILWSICQPFSYKKVKNSRKIKFIHIILVILGVFLPLISIIATTSRFAILRSESQNTMVTGGGIGYTSFTWPALYCSTFNINNDLHASILPTEILLAIGGPMLFIAFYTVYKNSKEFGTAEKKLLLMYSYYLLGTLLLIGSSTWSVTTASAAEEAIKDYFLCEGQGYDPNRPCSKDHRKFSSDIIHTVALAVFALYPIYVLIVVVRVKDLKEVFRKYNKVSLKMTELTSK